MITLSPDIVNYKSVSDTYSEGTLTEVETTISGIKCSVQPNGSSKQKAIYVNGVITPFKFKVLITSLKQINLLPVYNISDIIVINDIDYEILNRIDYQKHIEIYV